MSAIVAQGSRTLIPCRKPSYAACADLSLAYQVFGNGAVELVYIGSFVSHVELFWTMPDFEAFIGAALDVLSRRRVRTRRGSGCRTRSRKFGRWMIGRPTRDTGILRAEVV
jgi:hypothetical protein